MNNGKYLTGYWSDTLDKWMLLIDEDTIADIQDDWQYLKANSYSICIEEWENGVPCGLPTPWASMGAEFRYAIARDID